MDDFENVHRLAVWIINTLGKNQTHYMKDGAVCWDWVAAEIWNNYHGIFNEFVINDAIDFIMEAAENSQ
jgi:hypothetical protein